MINNSNINITQNNGWWYKNNLRDIDLINENPPANLNIATLSNKYNYSYLEDRTATGIQKIKEIQHINYKTWYMFTEEQYNELNENIVNITNNFILYSDIFNENNTDYKYCSEIEMFNYTKVIEKEIKETIIIKGENGEEDKEEENIKIEYENVNVTENGEKTIETIITYTYETWYLYNEETVNDIKIFDISTTYEFNEHTSIFSENNDIYKYCSKKNKYNYKKTIYVELNGFLINLPFRVDSFYYTVDEFNFNVNNTFYNTNEAPLILEKDEFGIDEYVPDLLYKFTNIINEDSMDEDSFIRAEDEFIYTRKKPILQTKQIYFYNPDHHLKYDFNIYSFKSGLNENNEDEYIVYKQLKNKSYDYRLYALCTNEIYEMITREVNDTSGMNKTMTWDVLNQNPNFKSGAVINYNIGQDDGNWFMDYGSHIRSSEATYGKYWSWTGYNSHKNGWACYCKVYLSKTKTRYIKNINGGNEHYTFKTLNRKGYYHDFYCPYNLNFDDNYENNGQIIFYFNKCSICGYDRTKTHSIDIYENRLITTKAYFIGDNINQSNYTETYPHHFVMLDDCPKNRQTNCKHKKLGIWWTFYHMAHWDDLWFNESNQEGTDTSKATVRYSTNNDGNTSSWKIFGEGVHSSNENEWIGNWRTYYLQSYEDIENNKKLLVNSNANVKHRIRWDKRPLKTNGAKTGQLIVPISRTNGEPFIIQGNEVINRNGTGSGPNDVRGMPMPATTENSYVTYRLNFILPVEYAGALGSGRKENIEIEVLFQINEAAADFEFNSPEYNFGTHVEVPGIIQEFGSAFDAAQVLFNQNIAKFNEINMNAQGDGYNYRVLKVELE